MPADNDIVWVPVGTIHGSKAFHTRPDCYKAKKVPTLLKYADEAGLHKCSACAKREYLVWAEKREETRQRMADRARREAELMPDA